MQRLFHLEQPLGLLHRDALDWNPGPHRHDLGDVLVGHLGPFGALLLVPAILELVDLLAELDLAVAQLRRELVLLRRDRRFFLVLNGLEPPRGLLQGRRRGRLLQPDPRRRFVDQVDRLIRKKTVGNVPRGELGRRPKGVVGNLEVVMLFVAVLDPAQDLDRFVDRRLVDLDRLESAL